MEGDVCVGKVAPSVGPTLPSGLAFSPPATSLLTSLINHHVLIEDDRVEAGQPVGSAI